jgi:hypothetical protein
VQLAMLTAPAPRKAFPIERPFSLHFLIFAKHRMHT